MTYEYRTLDTNDVWRSGDPVNSIKTLLNWISTESVIVNYRSSFDECKILKREWRKKPEPKQIYKIVLSLTEEEFSNLMVDVESNVDLIINNWRGTDVP